MLFQKLYVNYFGKFHNLELELKPGINLIYGENEAGKSTIHTFMKGMLFGIERIRGRASNSKEDLYTKYLPWDNPGAYYGSMDLKVGDKTYQLQRNFHGTEKSFKVFDKRTGREVTLRDGHISEIIPGLTETIYKNTISIEQKKAKTEVELSYEVRNYLANLSSSKSNEIDVRKAIQFLQEKKKEFELKGTEEEIQKRKETIKECYEIEEKKDTLTIELQGLLDEERRLFQQKEEVEHYLDSREAKLVDQFPAILETYHFYSEHKKQYTSLEKQLSEVTKKISNGEKGLLSIQVYQEESKKAEQLIEAIKSLEEQSQGLHKVLEVEKNEKRNRIIYGFLLMGLFGIIVYILYNLKLFKLTELMAFILVGLAVLTVTLLQKNRKAIRIKKNLESLHAELQKHNNKISTMLHKYKVNTVEELINRMEEVRKSVYALEYYKDQEKELLQRLEQIEEELDHYYDKIMGYMQNFFWEDELNEVAMDRLHKEITNKKLASIARKEEISKKLEACVIKIEKIKWEMESFKDNEELLWNNINRCEELEQKKQANSLELEAIQYAMRTIQELSIDIHDEFGKQLNDTASSVLREITDNKYTELKIDEKLEIKIGWRGSYLPLDRLSAGTIDQVYFALRISIGELLMKQTVDVPLILDDCFVFYDEKRVKAILRELSKKKQILLFTCHKREKELLDEIGISYHLVDLTS